ncbi:hypothetical protein NQ318_020999 [Aromia moschata]|uniref:BHLH domain-containing protein n=1 Tax=Aromia moschata TaxID=1265417 RepID=A0AAV8YLD6_9CUCU|nr:hypothetical protein NQ318_020999 [Aromia moschata]
MPADVIDVQWAGSSKQAGADWPSVRNNMMLSVSVAQRRLCCGRVRKAVDNTILLLNIRLEGYKLSKATVLQKSIDYIQYLQLQKKKQEEERNALRKEVVALRIMQTNYEQIVKAQQSQPGHTETRISDEVKFSVFQTIMDQLFITFSAVSVNNFSELSAGVFSWLEEYCKPQTLKDTVYQVLRRHNGQMRG